LVIEALIGLVISSDEEKPWLLIIVKGQGRSLSASGRSALPISRGDSPKEEGSPGEKMFKASVSGCGFFYVPLGGKKL
jgi:hypothetical protein